MIRAEATTSTECVEGQSMRRTAQWVLVVLAVFMGTGTVLSAAHAGGLDSDQSIAVTNAQDSASGQLRASQPDDAWRYRRHGGRWWYWLPSEKWVYWTGDRWTAYRPQSSSEFRAARPQRSYSYPADQGNWGPVRYDRFGQPQYPYSQRKSGLRQLGPVPALGGVRSLPGWGGER
jgi:hypothetical protein